jgi:hypothetical protein
VRSVGADVSHQVVGWKTPKIVLVAIARNMTSRNHSGHSLDFDNVMAIRESNAV